MLPGDNEKPCYNHNSEQTRVLNKYASTCAGRYLPSLNHDTSRLLSNRAGMFRVAGLNRLRAKQLSAAEVKRGLRRNVTGGGQNITPTISFYSQKVLTVSRRFK